MPDDQLMHTTVDTLLGKRFEVEQPAEGYRIAVDTLLLAAAVPARGGERVLELGCGVGGAMLALAARVPDVAITGIEIQMDMAALCANNIERNGWADRLAVRVGDVALFEERGTYDYVMINPPYHDPKSHILSPHQGKRIANALGDEADLALWIEKAAGALTEDGVLTMIHRADKMEEIDACMIGHGLSVEIKPIISKRSAPPKRVVVRGRKDAQRKETHVFAAFNLYGADGKYSVEAQALLREAASMDF